MSSYARNIPSEPFEISTVLTASKMERLRQTNTRLKDELEMKQAMLCELNRQTKSSRMNHQMTVAEISPPHKKSRMVGMLSLFLQLGGVNVKELTRHKYVVVFDIAVGGLSVAQYAVEINKSLDEDDWQLDRYHLPIGFPVEAISEQHKVATKDYFILMHRALSAYHDRLAQIRKLKDVLPPQIGMTHSLDGTYVELAMQLHNKSNEIKALCVLKYEPWCFRPKTVDISKLGVSEAVDIKLLKSQTEPFLTHSLRESFFKAFQTEDPQCYSLP